MYKGSKVDIKFRRKLLFYQISSATNFRQDEQIMAAAEARAAWQRANRCLVQEDAKRAPKIACCPSSSTSQNDSGIGNTASAKDHPASSFMPLSRIPMNSDLSPDTKWWLQLQPNFGYQKDCMCEQLISLEDEFDEEVENSVPVSNLSSEPLSINSSDFDLKKDGCSGESPWMVSTAIMKHGSETRITMKKGTSYSQQHPQMNKVDVSDYHSKDKDPLDWMPADRLISKKQDKASLDPDTRWAGGSKSEPWWRIADQDELASLVAQRSLQHIENCDLPRPTQIMRFTMDPYSSPDNLGTIGMFPSSLDQKLPAGMSTISDFSQRSSTSGRSDDKNLSSAEGGGILHNSESYTQDSASVGNGLVESNQTSGNEPSRAQLLEALRHSQTRARKAEMAAQKAVDEKEHVIKLLFRQASHLFAYKQWLQILQLETLCLQLKIKDHQLSALVPVLPWMPLKGKPASRKDKSNSTRRKGRKNKCSFCQYAVVVAVGLGMAGAGLLLGWTLGWLLPTF